MKDDTPASKGGYPQAYWAQIQELDRTVAAQTVIRWLDPAPADTILDMGCGTGRFMAAMERNGGKTIGIEPFNKPLSIAKGRVTGELIQATGDFLPFASEAFNKVLCNHVLEHLRRPKSAILEIHRVLQAEGILVLSYPNSDYLPYRLGLVGQDRTHFLRLGPTLGFQGFKRIKMRIFPSLPRIGDRVLELLHLSEVPIMRNIFYNVVVLLRKEPLPFRGSDGSAIQSVRPGHPSRA